MKAPTKKTTEVAPGKELPMEPARPSADQVKKVIGQIIQQFVNDEVGNKVTRNNMAGLTMQLHGAIDGHITIQEQEGSPQ